MGYRYRRHRSCSATALRPWHQRLLKAATVDAFGSSTDRQEGTPQCLRLVASRSSAICARAT
jgi:hypothetical protein